MRAAWYEKTGPAAEVLRLGDLPVTEPGDDEVLVRVRASGINPSDTKRRAGWRTTAMPFPRVVPHSDGAGVIEAVGAGVADSRIGERVWLYNAARGRAFGAAAEYCTLPSAQAVPLPDSVGFDEGACLGVPASTAHNAVFSDGPVDGQAILISGGAGAVGHYAIQFAAWGGATVITTVSSAEKADHARAAGAAHVIDYKTEDVAARIMDLTENDGVDRIVEVDFGANLAIDVEIIKQNGVIASYSSTAAPEPVLPYYPLAYKGVTVHFVQAYILKPAARRAAVDDITELLSRGTLTNTVAARFPLSDIAAAHEALESGRLIGNVIVEVD